MLRLPSREIVRSTHSFRCCNISILKSISAERAKYKHDTAIEVFRGVITAAREAVEVVESKRPIKATKLMLGVDVMS